MKNQSTHTLLKYVTTGLLAIFAVASSHAAGLLVADGGFGGVLEIKESM